MTAISRILSKIIAAVKSAASSFASLSSRNKPRRYQRQFIRHMQYLVSDIFSCLVIENYPENLYVFERRVHKEKINCLSWLELLKRHRTVERESRCFSLLIDAGQIRRRVTDHTVFALCRTELLTLESALLHFLEDFAMKDMAEALSKLQRALEDFEDCYQHVVNVASKEPVVFLLFMGSLRNLQELAVMEQNDD